MNTELKNFREALREANRKQQQAGRVTERQFRLVERICSEPVMTDRRGRRVNVLSRVHAKVSRLYLKDHPAATAIDWWGILSWLIANWSTILKIVVLVLTLI